MATKLDLDPDALSALCRRHSIRRLSVYGSVSRGSDSPESDVDLLVEFENGREPGLIGLAGIERELSELLGGRRIDLRTAADLSAYFRDDVLASAEVQFDSR